jgi:hypothetical protein
MKVLWKSLNITKNLKKYFYQKQSKAEKKGESTSHLKPPEDHATDDYVFC